MSEKHTVFVYGSLKRGHGLNHVLSTSEFLGRTHLIGPWRLVSLGAFPGLVQAPSGKRLIHGELYQVDPGILQRLDGIEGHPRFYERKVVQVSSGEEAWAYTLQFDEYGDYPEVEGGCW